MIRLLPKMRRHPSFLCGVLLTIATATAYLFWGGLGLAALFGGVVGLGLPLLLGESSEMTEDNIRHGGWKWDGSPDDGGSPYGRSISED